MSAGWKKIKKGVKGVAATAGSIINEQLRLLNPPNATSKIEITPSSNCTCDICDLDPFTEGIGEYAKDDLNGMFRALIGEATSPARAKQKKLSATSADHASEAFAMASVIFNRAAYDKDLISKKKPPKWGYNSDGTPLGVLKKSGVVAYTDGTYKTYFEQAKKLGGLTEGNEYCNWLVTLKEQIEKAANNPDERDAYMGWRTHPLGGKNATTILYTDFKMDP